MVRSFGTLLMLAVGLCTAAAQQPSPADASPGATTETLHTSTQLVVVDVVVEDRKGQPVHGLSRDSFRVFEQKKPQTMQDFEEHQPAAAPTQTPQVSLPPGVFTDYTPIPPGETLDVLLLDSLNTPLSDQSYVRLQLLKFLEKERPGARVAVFGLGNRLYMLQGFTSDPRVLRTVVEHLMRPRSSTLLADPTGTGADQQKLSDLVEQTQLEMQPNAAQQAVEEQEAIGVSTRGTVMNALAATKQFEAEIKASAEMMRAQYTMEAFNALGHYLGSFAGRKNLIWFSGSFPIAILPDSSLFDPFADVTSKDEEFREMASVLSRAQVAVYPVDARGLMIQPMFSAASTGGGSASVSSQLEAFNSSQAAEHATMDSLAQQTGGRAFYNTNELAEAAQKALNEGSSYYTLTYSPTDHRANGAFRNIRVELAGSAADRGLRLNYRRGYFADFRKEAESRQAVDPAAAAYTEAAISRGAPAPSDILFEARVRPLSPAHADTLLPDEQPATGTTMKAPYRRYAVTFAARTQDFSISLQPNGRRTGKIEFTVLVYDGEGDLLNSVQKAMALDLPPESYRRVAAGIPLRLQVSAPAKQVSFLRLIVHDIPSNRYGVVEIPTVEVNGLPPAPQPAAGAAGSPAAVTKQ
jgi:VWFA-related protein